MERRDYQKFSIGLRETSRYKGRGYSIEAHKVLINATRRWSIREKHI